MEHKDEKPDEIKDVNEVEVQSGNQAADSVNDNNAENVQDETPETDKKENKKGFFKKKNKSADGGDWQKKYEEVCQQFEEQKKQLADLNDKYVRTCAEYDNYRKRTMKEKMDLTKYASEGVLLNILPVVDNFERAMASIETAKELEPVKEGIYLIHGKFKEFLTQRGLKEIEAKNTEFNSDIHEAVTNIPAPSEELKGKVVDVVEKGYMLYDKVIRFSKVVVGE